MGIVSDGMYAVLAGSLGEWLKSNMKFVSGENILLGVSIYCLELLLLSPARIINNCKFNYNKRLDFHIFFQ
jgi:hypothetical protein